MKEEFMAVIKYRLQEAEDTLKEAKMLSGENMVRGAMNRTYYSMFYAALALLALKQLAASKHAGVIAIFHREFVNTNIFPKESAKYLDLAFDMRTKSDYREMVEVKKEQIDELIEGAEEFIKKAKEIALKE